MKQKELERNGKYIFTDAETFKSARDTTRVFTEFNYSKGMHLQEFFELNLIISGEGTHYIGQSCLPVGRGDVFIIPPTVPHGYEGKEGFDVCHILLSRRFMEKNIADLQGVPGFHLLFEAEPLMRASAANAGHLSLDDGEIKRLDDILKELNAHTDPDDATDALIRESAITAIIAHLCRIYASRISDETRVMENTDAAFMETLAYLNQSYNEQISIEALAKRARMSKSAFLKTFKQICHCCPSAYLKKLRVEAAEGMLTTTSLSVQRIAERCGFCDASHMVKCFLSLNRKTPSQIRKTSADLSGR